MQCLDEYTTSVSETLKFGFYSPLIPDLVYYSHFTAVIVTMTLGTYVYLSKRNDLLSKLLFAIAVSFSVLTLSDIALWVLSDSSYILFIWSFWLSLFLLIFFLSFYFLYVLLTKNDLPIWIKVLFLSLITIIEIFSGTTLNLQNINLSYCEASEGLSFVSLAFAIGLLVFLSSTVLCYYKLKLIRDSNEKNSLLFAASGLLLFQATFLISTYSASVINTFYVNDYNVFITEQYGFYGMTIFFCLLTYVIVKYKVLEIRILAVQALVIGLVILVASQFLFSKSSSGYILSTLTLSLTLVGGYNLVKSVSREVALREKIGGLVVDLDKANIRLKELDKMKSEFVSIASHQLRSPLTSIRGYASMLVDGSYGKIPEKASEVLAKIVDSSKFMALSIEDYLNVSRIEAGNMKYAIVDVNLKDVAEKVADELRQSAIKKAILLIFKSNITGSTTIRADIGKTRQIIMNLIDNAIKYTQKGTITVCVSDDVKKKKIYVTIEDTGMGMSKETQSEIFDKFVRAKNANTVNVTGTGLGLYVAKKMITDMGGNIWAESEGEGKGSKFHIEFSTV